MEIRALREGDDRSGFRSGDPDLDRFFLRFAGQNQFRLYLGVTYVAMDGAKPVGYATLAPGHVEVDRLPEASRRALPRYPLPILRLARLAVDETARGQGLGAALLRYVLLLARKMADELGCVGVVVDAKSPAVPFYEKFGFTEIEAVQGASEARPQPTLMFLPVSAIRAATKE